MRDIQFALVREGPSERGASKPYLNAGLDTAQQAQVRVSVRADPLSNHAVRRRPIQKRLQVLKEPVGNIAELFPAPGANKLRALVDRIGGVRKKLQPIPRPDTGKRIGRADDMADT